MAGKIGKIVGIDLGTTNTVVAYMKGQDPEILFTRDGSASMRSAVSLRKRRGAQKEEAEFLVGNAANKNWPMEPENTIVSIKRLMGAGFSSEEVQRVRQHVKYQIVKPSGGTEAGVRVMLGGNEFAPEDVSAMILRKVKEDAEYRLNEEVTHAVITVPAYFDQFQKAATLQAGLKAGLKVLKLLDEPTAAAFAYGMDEAKEGEAKIVLVYDLGGGTFDVSVMMWAGYAFVPMNIQGDMWLGGDDFDQKIVQYALEQIKKQTGIDPSGDAHFMVALTIEAQKAKEALSDQTSAEIILSGQLKGSDGAAQDVIIEITREQYEARILPLVMHSLDIVDKAIENAALTLADIQYVLLAGNSTMTPLVVQKVEEKFGRERVLKKHHPKHCVAEGAAIIAKLFNGVMCQNPECDGHTNDLDADKCAHCGKPLNKVFCPSCDTGNEPGTEACVQCGASLTGLKKAIEPSHPPASRHYGIQYQGDEFAIFVRKNDPLPIKEPRTMTFPTTMPNQRMIYIPVFGGEDDTKASNNAYEGAAFAELPAGLPKGTPVSISLSLDGDGIFQISARLENGQDLNPWIVKGGADDRAAELLEKVGQEEARKFDEGGLAPDDARRLEAKRQQVLDNLRKGDAAKAAEIAEGLSSIIESREDVVLIEQKAQNLIGFTNFITNEFDWLLGPTAVQELRRRVSDLEAALKSRDNEQIMEKFHALDSATDQLPQMLGLLLGMRAAISQKIVPMDPVTGSRLLQRLDQVTNQLKMDPQGGMIALTMLIQEVNDAMPGAVPPVKCPACGVEVAPGSLKCPNGHNISLGMNR
jgi:molecular chaperone DnaK